MTPPKPKTLYATFKGRTDGKARPGVEVDGTLLELDRKTKVTQRVHDACKRLVESGAYKITLSGGGDNQSGAASSGDN